MKQILIDDDLRWPSVQHPAHESALEQTQIERDALRQGIWDAYGILGFDQDGDASPAAQRYPMDKMIVEAATEARATSEETLSELIAAEAARDSARALAALLEQELAETQRRCRALYTTWARTGSMEHAAQLAEALDLGADSGADL